MQELYESNKMTFNNLIIKLMRTLICSVHYVFNYNLQLVKTDVRRVESDVRY